MNKKKIFIKSVCFTTLFVILSFIIQTLCGCTSIIATLIKPHSSTVKDPKTFLKEKRGIDLPSEASIDYNYAVSYPRGHFGYFLACYYPDVPEELSRFVDDPQGASMSEEEKNRSVERYNKRLQQVLQDGDKSLTDLDDRFKPDWETQFITNWETFINSHSGNFIGYFLETHYLLIWGNTEL